MCDCTVTHCHRCVVVSGRRLAPSCHCAPAHVARVGDLIHHHLAYVGVVKHARLCGGCCCRASKQDDPTLGLGDPLSAKEHVFPLRGQRCKRMASPRARCVRRVQRRPHGCLPHGGFVRCARYAGRSTRTIAWAASVQLDDEQLFLDQAGDHITCRVVSWVLQSMRQHDALSIDQLHEAIRQVGTDTKTRVLFQRHAQDRAPRARW